MSGTHWTSYVQLVLTIVVVGGVIAIAVIFATAISQTIKTTKATLKSKGYNITDKGVSIKTEKRFDREAYVDATQRGFIKAMEASSFRNPEDERKQRDKAAAKASAKDDGWRKRLKRSGSS